MGSAPIAQIPLAPLSNMMNTRAYSGQTPFNPTTIWTNIVSDVLLFGGVVIPGTSFLCNPAILQWLDSPSRRELLEWLWLSGKLRVLFYADTKYFEHLGDVLIEKDSAALGLLSSQQVVKLAKRLDGIFGEKSGKLLTTVAAAEAAKNDISSRLIRDPSALGDLSLCGDVLKNQAKFALSNGLVLDGTWWIGLAGTCPQLAACLTQLSRVGVAVFDFAHSSILDKHLSGHTYAMSISNFQQMARPLLREAPSNVPPVIRDGLVNSVDPTVFVKDMANLLTVAHMQSMAKDDGLKSAYGDLAVAFEAFYQNPKEQTLQRAKVKFDSHLNALGAFIRTQPMLKYLHVLQDLKRCESKLTLIRSGQSCVSVLMLDKIPLGPIVMHLLKWRQSKLEATHTELKRELDARRPFPFKTLTKPAMPTDEFR